MFKSIEHTSKMATIGRLAASVAHEINNPLAIINEKAGLLTDLVGSSREYPQKEKFLHSLDSIAKSVERCRDVTHRLLGFTRRVKLRWEPIDMRSLVNETLGFLEKEAMLRSIDVQTSFASDLPSIISNRGQLEEVLLNLLHNAFAAVEDGGKIRVSVETEGPDRVSIGVEDNGCGIPEGNLGQIFEPFFSTKGDFGTGLGLCISYDLVQKLGGKIEVWSRIDEGTRFAVTLPVNREKPLE
jgi:signal transduction histidine kinase